MVFCGRCGLQLAPGSSRCPRCGALTEVDVISENQHMNDATAISPRQDALNTLPAQPGYAYPAGATPVPPSHVIVRSADPTSPDILDPNAPTAMFSSPGVPSTPFPSSDPISYPGYLPPSAPGQYNNWQTPPPQEPKRHNGGIIALVIVILIVLLALGGTAAAVLNPSLVQGLVGGHATPQPAATSAVTATVPATATMASTPTPTPIQEARATIIQYYSYVNAQDYQDAYNIWGSAYQASQSYSSFAAGYANTIHDSITINSLTPQPDGTIIADVTIQATEQTSSGPVVSTYQGQYDLGIQNGSWKFLNSQFTKIS